MKNSLKWTAAFLAACMLLSAGVMAEDVADETTEPTAEAETTEAAAETTDEQVATVAAAKHKLKTLFNFMFFYLLLLTLTYFLLGN